MSEYGLPSATDMERTILGAVILDDRVMPQTEGLEIADFSLDSHRRIFRAMNEMHADGVPIDIQTISQYMGTKKQLEAVGGAAYLSGLTDGVPTRANIEFHCKVVKEKAQLRWLINEANKVISRAVAQQDKPEQILSDFNGEAVKIASYQQVKDRDIFLGVSKFIRQYHADIEWRIDNVLEMGTNGIIYGASGDGKSPLVRSLAVSLATGLDWLDLRVKRCRVALVSREDYAGTTSRFIKRLFQGMGIDDQAMLLDEWLYINSRAQTQSLFIDNPSDLRLLVNNLKRRHTQFCILDVLNVLHSKDENDNTEMRKVLTAIDHIRDEVGCQVMLLHHVGKAGQATEAIVGAGRGSSAMDGFAEFKWRIRTEDEDLGVRSIRFKVKAGQFQAPFFWKIVDQPNGGVTLERTEWNTKPQQKRMM